MKQRTNIPWHLFVKHWRAVFKINKGVDDLAKRGMTPSIICVGDNHAGLVGAIIKGIEVRHQPHLQENFIAVFARGEINTSYSTTLTARMYDLGRHKQCVS